MPCMSAYIGTDPLYQKYHDEEWSRPEHDEQKLYALFVLELFQAGLSWRTLLHKRENFRKAFDDFDVHKIASYDETKIEALMHDAGIIRNRRKIEAAVTNAKVILQIRKEYGSFSSYLWHFTNGKSIVHDLKITHDALSDDVSKDMKKWGMKFCGTVTIYSFLQAAGIIYSHTRDCPCWKRDGADAFTGNRYRRKRTKKAHRR